MFWDSVTWTESSVAYQPSCFSKSLVPLRFNGTLCLPFCGAMSIQISKLLPEVMDPSMMRSLGLSPAWARHAENKRSIISLLLSGISLIFLLIKATFLRLLVIKSKTFFSPWDLSHYLLSCGSIGLSGIEANKPVKENRKATEIPSVLGASPFFYWKTKVATTFFQSLHWLSPLNCISWFPRHVNTLHAYSVGERPSGLYHVKH